MKYNTSLALGHRFTGHNGRFIVGRSQGFSLLEVLIAMLVLAVGLLGVAAMQMRGLQYSHDAYLRSQVSILAYDMADRIRLNRANSADYVTAPWTIPTSAPTGCTPGTVGAAMDILCWKLQLSEALPPDSTAEIALALDPLEGDEYTIDIQWQDRALDPTHANAMRSIQYTFVP